MQTTLDKIKILEQLISINRSTDNVIELTIDKILNREIDKLKNQIKDLKIQLNEF